MNNEIVIKENKRLSEALKSHPKINIANRLDTGNGKFGEAYLLKDGRVLKITIDDREYSTAMILKNRKSKHLINIYEGWCFYCIYNDGHSDSVFAIIEEFVDTNSKKDIIEKFVFAFKQAWFSIYFSDIERKRMATFDDLDEYMRHPEKYPDAMDFTKQHVLNEGEKYNLRVEFENMYNQLVCAYTELFQNAPNSHLDLNDGNIGFTSDGTLKVFDMQ